MEILVKNGNFGQKSKFWLKIVNIKLAAAYGKSLPTLVGTSVS